MLFDFKENLVKVGFPQILVEDERIQKLKSFSTYLLDYYNFLDKNSGLKTKVSQFKQDVLLKDSDPANMKYGVNKMDLNNTLMFLQINLLEFLGTVFSMKEEPTTPMLSQEESKTEEEMEERKENQFEDKSFPSYSHTIIPVLILSTASLINEVNEKAKHILRTFEKHSDMDQNTAEVRSTMSEDSKEDRPNSENTGMNAVSVWADTMKFYLSMVKESMPNNLTKFDDQTKKTVVLYTRNLKRNVLEYALK